MSRLPVAVALGVLLAALAVALVATTPWDPLSGARVDAGSVDLAREFGADAVARERAFSAAIRPPAFAALAVGLLVPLVLGLTPLGARLVGGLGRPTGSRWWLQALLGVVVLVVVGRLASLPLSARAEVVRREYGLSTRDWPMWAADVGRSLLVSAVVTALVVLVVVGLARALPRTWWAWAAGATAALVVAGSFAYPVLVEPLFNRFTPMSAGPLRASLLELAERDGVPVDDVLVADASRRTTALNAYVSGFGSTRRIVVYDTLLREASADEVRLVVAHELGHAERRDVLSGTLLGALGAAAAVCALALLLSWGPLLRRAGADGAGDPRAVALLLALLALGTWVAAPVANVVSRRVEARADVHALDLTGDADLFVAAQKRLAVSNLSDLRPSPLVTLLLATHPSPAERVALARAWRERRS